jgi:hypothetical protein
MTKGVEAEPTGARVELAERRAGHACLNAPPHDAELCKLEYCPSPDARRHPLPKLTYRNLSQD